MMPVKAMELFGCLEAEAAISPGFDRALTLRSCFFMTIAKRFNAMLVRMVAGVVAVSGFCATTASGTPVAYVAGPTANGSSSIQSGTDYTTNLGYAFKRSGSGSFSIDWIKLELTSGATSGSGSFKISINGTDNDTPLSAVASSTVYAADTVNFTTPATPNTPFFLELSAAAIPNIAAAVLSNTPSTPPNTAYSIFVNSASGSGIALRRRQGLASGNDAIAAYTVTNGFTVLDTFRNNGANYANSQGPPVSYAAFAMSFGTTQATPIPEIDPSGVGSVLALVSGALGLLERRRLMAKRA
jgi:hypothetical protein